MSVTHREDSVLAAQKKHGAETRVADSATLTDGNLIVAVSGGAVCDGTMVKFKAPCNGDEVTGSVQVQYTKEGTTDTISRQFTCVDAMGGTVTGIGGAWISNAMVSIVLDCSSGFAYLQNSADYDIDCGTFTEDVTLAMHSVDETAHSNLSVDGNA